MADARPHPAETGPETGPATGPEAPPRAAHYETGTVQPIDLIFALGDGPAFCRGNVIKYAARSERKDGLRDLNKARDYLDWWIAFETDGTLPSDGRKVPAMIQVDEADIRRFLNLSDKADLGPILSPTQAGDPS